jgi:nucleoside-diphosphate-sugar epimerase
VLAMNDVAANQTYNLEGSRKVSVLDVAQGIRALVGDHVQIVHGPERPGDFGGKDVSGAKAARDLNWTPNVDFEAGLRRTVAWFRQKWGK